ncbi:MAG TPA: ABC transporter ATP-binding protein [Pyrinomonadaceae bacterium]|nr:ABC transporter ATP-binding protein [Pyrinomonadaceae bacterium]
MTADTTRHDGLSVSNLSKSFLSSAGAPIEVLRGVSFEASAGETLAVVGASGAGKSTLLHLLGGIEKADSGEIKLGEFDVARASARHLASFRSELVGLVFQFHHLLPDLTAAENVAMPLLIRRESRKMSMERAVSSLEQIGLGERASQPVGHLSGGEQQRVAVLRALVTRPHMVLADEPTGNLDNETGERIGAMLVSYCRERRAIVIIATHNEQLARACDRILLLRAGSLESEV